MERKHLPFIALLFLLLAATIISLTGQVRQAKNDAVQAREMTLESQEYEVQVMNISMYAPLSGDAVRGWDFTGDPSLTASGEEVIPGETAAAGPNVPFGTRIYVEGIGWRTVNDRGRLIGPNDIDLAVETKQESLEFGKQQRLVIIKGPEEAFSED